MSEYNPKTFKAGEMDISVQQSTFDGFMKTSMIVTVCSIAVCIFLLITAV